MGTIDIVMAKKAYEKAQKKLAEKAAIDAKKALKSDVDLMTEETKLAEVAAIVEQPAPPVVPVVTVLPGPVKTVEETATGKAAAHKKSKHADVVAEKNTAVLAARGITHGERITSEKELSTALKQGIIVIYAGKPAQPLDAEYNQAWQVKPDAEEPDLFLRFRWLHNGRESGKRENLANSAAVWNRDKLEPARLMFSGKWRDITCYKIQ